MEQVENGELLGTAPAALLARYVSPLMEKSADTLVLGCSHYPFLNPLIRDIAGPEVAVIDPAAAIARELGRRLTANGLLMHGHHSCTERFWSSGPLPRAQAVMARLWEKEVHVQRLPEEYCGL